MGMDGTVEAEVCTIIDAALRGEVSDAQAERVYELGCDAVTAFVLAAARHFAEIGVAPSPGPHTPSSAIPVYARPAAAKR